MHARMKRNWIIFLLPLDDYSRSKLLKQESVPECMKNHLHLYTGRSKMWNLFLPFTSPSFKRVTFSWPPYSRRGSRWRVFVTIRWINLPEIQCGYHLSEGNLTFDYLPEIQCGYHLSEGNLTFNDVGGNEIIWIM